MRALVARLDAEEVRLPGGDRLTSRRLPQLGQLLGFSDGAERLHALLERTWPRLYDRARLAANEVPAAAVIYADDAYVPRPFSEQTATQIAGLRTWLTDEYRLRADGERILDRLLDLTRGRAERRARCPRRGGRGRTRPARQRASRLP